MIKTLITTLFLLCFTFSIAQNSKLDSLKSKYANEDNLLHKLETLNLICDELKGRQNDSESLKYFYDLVKIGEESDSLFYVQKGYGLLSINYQFLGDSTKAIQYGKKALELSFKLNNLKLTLYSHVNLGQLYNHFRQFEKAKRTFQAGIDLNKEQLKDAVTPVLFSNLGIAYENLGDNEKAIQNYVKSAEFADKIGDIRAQAIAKYNIGYIYGLIKQFDKSEENLFEALELAKQDKRNEDYQNYSHYSLAINYENQDKHDLAIINFEKCLKYFKAVNNLGFVTNVQKNLASIYLNTNQPKKAASLAEEALVLAEKLSSDYYIDGARSTLILAYLDLKEYNKAEALLKQIKSIEDLDVSSKIDYYNSYYRLSKERNDFKKALDYYIKVDDIMDSVALAEKESNVLEVETRYQTEKKEEEIKQLNEEKDAQRRNLLYSVIGIGLLTAFLAVVFYLYRKTANQKDTIVTLQKETHHRIKNNLAIISSFIDVAKDETTDEKAILSLNDLQHRVAGMEQVHSLFTGVALEKGRINFSKIVPELFEKINKSVGSKSLKISMPENLESDYSSIFPLALIFNEFVTNSNKHNSESQWPLEINFSKNNGGYTISLADSSAQLPLNFDPNISAGYGMNIMTNLAKQMNGTPQWNTDKGIKLTIKIS